MILKTVLGLGDGIHTFLYHYTPTLDWGLYILYIHAHTQDQIDSPSPLDKPTVLGVQFDRVR